MDPRWQERAACRGMDPGLWYPEAGETANALASATCVTCPIRQDCLEYALANRERYGIWGGASEKERRRILRQRNGPSPNMARAPRRKQAG